MTVSNHQRLYFVTTFLSSFLLFSIQPIIGKILLPLYGGGGAIWATAMLFFIAIFFLGNVYSYSLSKVKGTMQSTIHLSLVIIAMSVIFVSFHDFHVLASSFPILSILLTLSLSIGLPYFLLSTTNPYLQAHYVAHFPKSSPYQLYSLANLGSLL